MELIDTIKGIITDCVCAMDLTDICYGTVVSASPLTLNIQAAQFKITEPVAVAADSVRYKAVKIQGEPVVLNPGLQPGDRVLILRANAGQNYIVISKV